MLILGEIFKGTGVHIRMNRFGVTLIFSGCYSLSENSGSHLLNLKDKRTPLKTTHKSKHCGWNAEEAGHSKVDFREYIFRMELLFSSPRLTCEPYSLTECRLMITATVDHC